jgi:hypothetical protein
MYAHGVSHRLFLGIRLATQNGVKESTQGKNVEAETFELGIFYLDTLPKNFSTLDLT